MTNDVITRQFRKKLADTFTPVNIYLRLRDRFVGALLLECTDYHIQENSFSFICINPVAEFKIEKENLVLKFRDSVLYSKPANGTLIDIIDEFIKSFQYAGSYPIEAAGGFYGYTTFDAVYLFDKFQNCKFDKANAEIPLLMYQMFQVVIAFNHYNDELYICENLPSGYNSMIDEIDSLLANKNISRFPFKINGEEEKIISDQDFIESVEHGIKHCQRGDVFQIVPSRRFQQKFSGDDFNVYRALRSINPSPYLFYFDYGNFRLFGSSPEQQLKVEKNKAYINPIAGTFKRTGNDEQDKELAIKLLNDEKENAEHIMLVDLARNDLSMHCKNVEVIKLKEIQFYSHVIHLVSTVSGDLDESTKPFALFCSTFPAGTLSGAPKHRAIELINKYEKHSRGYYGGAIGFFDAKGNINHAILIRSFLSKNNTLIYQGGAGVVVSSNPELELQEVNNKLNALRKAIINAQEIQ